MCLQTHKGGPWTLEVSSRPIDDRDMSPTGRPDQVRKGRFVVLMAELRCVVGTLLLSSRRALAMPRRRVGCSVRFADDSRSRIYRETVVRQRSYDDLVLLVVRFRLRFIGLSRFGHWLFRRESILNTLLFAAHAGFQTKLWLTDEETGFYRGIYEWKGRDAAEEYVETLRIVLRPWVVSGSFAYRIIEGWSRDAYLEGDVQHGSADADDGWWLPSSAHQVRL